MGQPCAEYLPGQTKSFRDRRLRALIKRDTVPYIPIMFFFSLILSVMKAFSIFALTYTLLVLKKRRRKRPVFT